MAVAGCADDARQRDESAVQPPATAAAPDDDDLREGELDDVEREPSVPAGDPDGPDERGRLEAACFHGSTEACDRLGH